MTAKLLTRLSFMLLAQKEVGLVPEEIESRSVLRTVCHIAKVMCYLSVNVAKGRMDKANTCQAL